MFHEEDWVGGKMLNNGSVGFKEIWKQGYSL